MEIIGMAVLVVIGLAVVIAAASGGGRRRSNASAGEPAPGGAADARPMRDRPAGPSAEANTGPSPGVLHPEEQHDAGGAPDAAPRAGTDEDRSDGADR